MKKLGKGTCTHKEVRMPTGYCDMLRAFYDK